jgi:hypothetical protein
MHVCKFSYSSNKYINLSNYLFTIKCVLNSPNDFQIHRMFAGMPELGGGGRGAGGAAAPVALYREGQGGQRCPFNLKDCLGKIANCQKC